MNLDGRPLMIVLPSITVDPLAVTNMVRERRAVPPIQYMTADQIRRARGSMASLRELPPEQPSIWKYWNFYSCLGGFSAIMLSKEFFVTGGHDMFEAILLWSIFGTI